MPVARSTGQKGAGGQHNPADPNGPAKKKKNRVRHRNRKKAVSAADQPPVADISTNVVEIFDTHTEQKLEVLEIRQTQKSVENNPEKPSIQAPADAIKLQTEETISNNKIEMKQSQNSTGHGQIDVQRQQILAQREAKKQAKQAKKQKSGSDASVKTAAQSNVGSELSANSTSCLAIPMMSVKKHAVGVDVSVKPTISQEKSPHPKTEEKSREQIKADREAKKLAKQAVKMTKQNPVTIDAELTQKMASVKIAHNEGNAAASVENATAEEKVQKKPNTTKAERRALQEAQRAAKSNLLTQKSKVTAPTATKFSSSLNKSTVRTTPSTKVSATVTATVAASSPDKITIPTKSAKAPDCNVKLFNHLIRAQKDINLFVNNPQIHPIIARLGEQYAKRTVVGSNSRCIAFLKALKIVIQDFETPPKKEFARSLEAFIKNCADHLHKCRPLAVSVSNAYKHIKHMLTQMPADKPESELKESLCHFIDTYLENQIGKAALAISYSLQEKISNGDVLLTFGCSSLIYYIFEEAHRRNINFRVIVVDSRPCCEGQELLRRLCTKGISCTYVLINAVSFVMPEVTKILLGAHALLSNGYVMARTGTAQVALVGCSFNVPVLVCCETHKFSERFQTDAIVYNELGDPDDLIMSDKCCLTNWQGKHKMTPLNLTYDVTPPELVTAVVTEVSILPCTSVPVILRIKPTEIGYYN